MLLPIGCKVTFSRTEKTKNMLCRTCPASQHTVRRNWSSGGSWASNIHTDASCPLLPPPIPRQVIIEEDLNAEPVAVFCYEWRGVCLVEVSGHVCRTTEYYVEQYQYTDLRHPGIMITYAFHYSCLSAPHHVASKRSCCMIDSVGSVSEANASRCILTVEPSR